MSRRDARLLASGLAAFAAAIFWGSRPLAAEPPLEVTVQADSAPQRSIRDPSAASTVLRGPELQGFSSNADLLARVPGAQVARSGSQAELSTVSLRGMSSSQTPVYLAGVRINDDITASADLSTVPMFLLDRIEVFRGHAPAYADELGMGGAIFFEPRLPRHTEISLGQSAGSFGAFGTWVEGGVGNADGGALLALRHDRANNDYEYVDDRATAGNPDDDRRSRRKNADFASTNLWTLGRQRLSRRTQLLWMLDTLSREQGSPGLAAVPALHARSRLMHQLGAVSSTSDCSGKDSLAGCQLQISTSLYRARDYLRDPDYELALGTSRLDTRAQRAAERVRLSIPVFDILSADLLARGSVETLNLTSAESSELSAKRRQLIGGIGLSFWPWSRLELLALGRAQLDATEARGSTSPQTQSTRQGRLGARLDLFDELSLYANWGRYHRLPTLGELYGQSAEVTGNPELGPETSRNLDVGLSAAQSGRLIRSHLQLYAYRQDAAQLVAWQRSSFGQVRPYNVGQARIEGIELEASAEWQRWLSLAMSAALLDPRDVTPGRELENDILPYRARLTAAGALDLRLPDPVAWAKSAGVTLRARYRSSRYAVPAGNVVLDAVTIFDFEARIRPSTWPVTFRAGVLNLLDQPGYDLLGQVLPGRSLHASAEFNWELGS